MGKGLGCFLAKQTQVVVLDECDRTYLDLLVAERGRCWVEEEESWSVVEEELK